MEQIKAQELRIGNYVIPLVGSEKHIGEITSLTTKYAWIDLVDDNYEEDLSRSHEIEIKNLQPIPLDESILLSIKGIEKKGFDYLLEGYLFHLSGVETNLIWRFKHNGYDRQIEIYYLHELQNFIKDHRKTELEINLKELTDKK